MQDQQTEHGGWPLPHPDNKLADDVLRLRQAMHEIDSDLADLAGSTQPALHAGMQPAADLTGEETLALNQGGAARVGTLSRLRTWVLSVLGNAAGKTVTESPNDATAGRLLQVGDWGLGAEQAPLVADANLAKRGGIYRLGAASANNPFAAPASLLVLGQTGYTVQTALTATGLGVRALQSTAPEVWAPWALYMHNGNQLPLGTTPASARAAVGLGVAPLGAGGVIDCSKGDQFYGAVASAVTLSLVNVPAGAYSCSVELYHTGGSITLPAGCAWAGGKVPTFTVARRHLLYFQRSFTGSGGWIVSALEDAPA